MGCERTCLSLLPRRSSKCRWMVLTFFLFLRPQEWQHRSWEPFYHDRRTMWAWNEPQWLPVSEIWGSFLTGKQSASAGQSRTHLTGSASHVRGNRGPAHSPKAGHWRCLTSNLGDLTPNGTLLTLTINLLSLRPFIPTDDFSPGGSKCPGSISLQTAPSFWESSLAWPQLFFFFFFSFPRKPVCVLPSDQQDPRGLIRAGSNKGSFSTECWLIFFPPEVGAVWVRIAHPALLMTNYVSLAPQRTSESPVHMKRLLQECSVPKP